LNEQLLIRAAHREDMGAIARLWTELVHFHRAIDTRLPPPAPDGARRYAERLEDRLDDRFSRVLVAEQDGMIVGYVFGMVVDLMSDLFVHEACGFIADIYVADAHRQMGVGRALVGALTEWFAERGAQYYEWHVADRNHEAKAFWQALGGEAVLVRMRHTITGQEGT
jgi:GNAT superfamily N-acetyltransferase